MHGRVEYACGHLRTQCRCPDHGRNVTRLSERCPLCRNAPQRQPRPSPGYDAMLREKFWATEVLKDRERLIDDARD